MGKLGLNHIAPYLPYGLKYQGYYGGVSTMRDIKHIRDYNEETDEYTPNIQVDGYTIEFIKPLLRPLSDLYKEIDGNVGIVELAKIATGLDWSKRGWELSDLNEVSINQDGSVISFSFNKGNFSLKYRARTKLNYTTWGVSNQLDLFTYLFQHHYDVFGLIDKGLAIDLNSISHE